MFKVGIGEYELCLKDRGLPDLIGDYQRKASLSEDFEVTDDSGGTTCFLSVGRPQEWPSLVVIQRYSPADYGFSPGVLLVPQSHRLFVGAGTRLLAYDLIRPSRLWEDEAPFGFWSWSQHGSVVLMAAEIEFSAWDTSGVKLWSRFVEPPWNYAVSDGVITLDVMGTISRIGLEDGEPV